MAEVDFQDNQKIKFYKPREKVSDGKIRDYFTPFFFNKETTGNWLRSLAVLTISGGLAVVSPFVLKVLVDGMTNCLLNTDLSVLKAAMASATTFPMQV